MQPAKSTCSDNYSISVAKMLSVYISCLGNDAGMARQMSLTIFQCLVLQSTRDKYTF